jgi:hypothetical protein
MKTWSLKLWVGTIASVLAVGSLTVVGLSEATGQSAKSAAESSDAADATYTWSAELVAFDAASNTVTVKTMLVSNPEKNDLPALHAGDDAVLTWTGLSTAAGVRAIERGNTSSFDRLTMPIEYVASELDGRYVSFKVPIPAKDAAKIARLSPGAYVTATSPLRAKSADEAVTEIRPYNDLSSAADAS